MPLRSNHLLHKGGFGIGTDICHIPRIARLIQANKQICQLGQHPARRKLYAFTQHLLTDWEDCDLWRRYHQDVAFRDHKRLTQFLAGRWAAKEALFKAFSGIRELHRQNIEIRAHAETGVPVALISDEPGSRERTLTSLQCAEYYEHLFGHRTTEHPQPDELKVPEIEHGEYTSISISHDGDYSTAVAIAVAG